MSKSNKTSNPITIELKHSRIEGLFNDIYRQGAEHVINGFASGQLDAANAQEIADDCKQDKANWPDVKISYDGVEFMMSIVSDGTILYQDYIGAEKSKNKASEESTTVPKLKAIINYLDDHIIGQSEAKRICARAAKFHYERCFGESSLADIKLDKQNVIVPGPSGCGKTEIWRKLSDYLGVPVFIEDSSMLSPTGYKGRNVEDMAREIWLQCNKDNSKAEKCIVVLDEWDKLGLTGNGSGVGEFRQSVLNDLLKFVEGGVISFKEYATSPSTEFLDTTNILVVALGAFEGIEALFAESGSIGFGAENIQTVTPERNDIIDKIDLSVFEKWGFNSQIMGRFPIRAHVKSLTVDELSQIQTDVPSSIYHQWTEMFARLDGEVSLEFTKPAIQWIAKKASQTKTGARELVGIYAEILGKAYDTAEMDENISSVKVVVKNGQLDIQYSHEINALERVFGQQITKTASTEA